MTARWPIPRPTEHAAIRAACRSTRPLPPVEVLLDQAVTAHRMRDREGLCLRLHAAARSALQEVGE